MNALLTVRENKVEKIEENDIKHIENIRILFKKLMGFKLPIVGFKGLSSQAIKTFPIRFKLPIVGFKDLSHKRIRGNSSMF